MVYFNSSTIKAKVKNMILSNVLTTSDKKCNKLILSGMRELLLSEKYTPMNTDLFYDQFFNYNNLSNEVYNQIKIAKQAWEGKSNHFTLLLDQGLSDFHFNNLKAIEGDNFFKYHMLNNKGCFDSISNLKDIYNLFKSKQELTNINKSQLSKIFLDNEDIYPNHLPENFHTYLENYNTLSNNTEAPSPCIIESPFAGDISDNVEYTANLIVELLLHHNKAPMASHLLYTRMLDDNNAHERKIGINAGLSYGKHADETIVCIDKGLSTGMKYGVIDAIKNNRPFTCFTLSKDKLIQEEVKSLSSLERIEEWVSLQINKNKQHFKTTGYIVNLANNLEQKNKIKNNFK